MTEAFVYKFINSKTNKAYIGVHKGNESDGYGGSSTNKEFHNDRSFIAFTREIIARGGWDEMQRRELEEIARAQIDGEDLYNINVSSAKRTLADHISGLRDAVQRAQNTYQINDISDDLFPVTQVDTEDLQSIKAYQVRAEDTNQEKVREIAELIKDAMPNKQHLRPVIIVRNVPETIPKGVKMNHGGRLLIDGNHTRAACLQAKRPLTPVIYIDYEKIKNELALHEFGLAMNSDPVIRDSSSKSDILIYVEKQYDNKQDLNDPDFRIRIASSFCKSRDKISKIIDSFLAKKDKAAKLAKKEKDLAKKGEQLVKYTRKDLEHEINKKIAEIKQAAPAPLVAEEEVKPVVSHIGSHATAQGIGMILSQVAATGSKAARGVMLIHKPDLDSPDTETEAAKANAILDFFGIKTVRAEALKDSKKIGE